MAENRRLILEAAGQLAATGQPIHPQSIAEAVGCSPSYVRLIRAWHRARGQWPWPDVRTGRRPKPSPSAKEAPPCSS